MRWVGRILGGLLALALVAYLGVNLYSWFSTRHAKNLAEDRLTEQLASAVPAAREHQRRLAEALGAPEHSWLVQRCDVKTDDAGWMVQNYRQDCDLQAVDAYAAGSLAEARRLVSEAPADLVGGPVDESGGDPDSGCTQLRGTRDDATSRPGEGTLTAVFVGPEPAGEDYWCGRGYQPSQYRPEQTVSGDHVTLDGSRSWLLVSRTEQLGNHSMGCMHWSVLFCDRPSGLPVFGTAPEG